MRRRAFLAGVAASPVAAARAQPVRNLAWPAALTMGTASPGGTYAVYGPAWGILVQDATGVGMQYRATQGPSENILLLDRDAVDFGMTTMGVARQAWNGSGDWTHGTRLRSFRSVFPMYDTPFHAMVPARSAVRDLRDLAGRAVGVGPFGGTAGTYYPTILRLLGVPEVEFRTGTMTAQAAALAAGTLDSVLLAAGAPVPAFAAAAEATPLRVIGFSAGEAARLRPLLPELSPSIVAAGAYRGLAQPLATLGMFNFAVCRRGLPDDLVHETVAAVLTNQAALLRAGPLAAGTIAANAGQDTFLPFHPGAARYYAERGDPLPAALVLD